MSVKIRVKNNRLYLDTYHKGLRRWEALNLSLSTDKNMNKEVLRIAEICRAKRELQVVCGEWGLTDYRGGKQKLYEYMQKLADKRKKRKDPVRACLAYLEKFNYGKTISLEHINSKWIDSFQEFLLERLAPRSAKVYAWALRYALKKALNENLIIRDPSNGVPVIKVNEKRRVFLNVDEVAALARTPLSKGIASEVKKAFLFACLVGLRISDLRQLKWGDIEVSPLQIVKLQEKTDSLVHIPLNESAWAIINDGTVHNNMDSVFPLIAASPSDRYKIIKRWAREAGITKNISWHTARHTFAVLSLEGGAEIYTVSKLLGHNDVKTTQIYAEATDKMKRKAVASLPEIRISN